MRILLTKRSGLRTGDQVEAIDLNRLVGSVNRPYQAFIITERRCNPRQHAAATSHLSLITGEGASPLWCAPRSPRGGLAVAD
jgi:hypothetical protein